MHAFACWCMCSHSVPVRTGQRQHVFLETELQAVVSLLMWVLEAELGFFRVAVPGLNT